MGYIDMLQLGRFRLCVLDAGTFKVDGGAMFGVVPKVLWSKSVLSDEINRVTLALNVLLVQDTINKKNLLIDSGIGNFYDEKLRSINEIDNMDNGCSKLEKSLKKVGLAVEDIDFVLLTHLHYDHVGGCVTKNAVGAFKLTFPKARYIIQQLEWCSALSPSEREEKAYFPILVNSLKQNEKYLDIIDGDSEILSGIRIIKTGGHSRGHQVILIESDNQTAIHWGDLIPTTFNLPLTYISSYDIDPETTLLWKKKLLYECAKYKWISFFNHDLSVKFCHLKPSDKPNRYEVSPIV